MIDVSPSQLETVTRILAEHVPDCEVRAFGSRAAWTAKDYSDLDLAVVCDGVLGLDVLGRLKEAFEESDLPFRVDVLDWHAISSSFQKVIEKKYEVVQKGRMKSPVGADENWSDVKLSEIIDVKHGFAFPGKKIRENPPGDILLTPGNFAVGGGFKGDKYKYFDGQVPEEYVLHEGDLIVTMTDLSKQADTLGYPAIVPKLQHSRFLHNQRLGKVEIRDPAKVDKRFVSYLLRAPVYRQEVFAGATGTTVKHTSPGRILAFKASIPPLSEQRFIAHILGTLDDKIEMNRRMNETLEATARALFKSWFVDFDPVRAKAEGRDPGLPKTTADLFPDSFKDSELGAVPKGWEVKGIDEIAHFLNGLALQKYPPGDGATLPVIKIAQLRKGVAAGADRCNSSVPPEYVINDGDVLFSWSGSLECVLWTDGRGALNQHLFKVTSAQFSKWFYYLWVHEHLTSFRHTAAGKATTMGHIQRHHLSDAKVVVPEPNVLSAADEIFAPIIEQVVQRRVESHTLADLRDTLLPKLISGELRTSSSDAFSQEMAL